MSRNPFKPAADQTTEFGFGAGMYPRADIDFSQGGTKSGIPIADPDRRAQYRDLQAMRRGDLQSTHEFEPPAFLGVEGTHPAHYQCGNTERFGANPPLVRERRKPDFTKEPIPKPRKTERAW